MTLIKKYSFGIIFLLILSNVFISCEDDPTSVGITFIDPDDTTTTRVLDSQIDTMEITADNYSYYINTYTSGSFMIGNYQNYTSKSMLKFVEVSPDYDSSKIISAVLTLRYNGYYFQQDKGLTSFDIYKMTSDFNYPDVNYDSVTSSDYGNVSQGSYLGTPSDTQQINIPLNNSLAGEWLEYAADTSYQFKNYGLMLLPNASSNTIKGFYSFVNTTELIPFVTIILTKNGVQDTVTLNISEQVSLTNAPLSVVPADRFALQTGIAFRNVLNFDLSKLPPNVIINNVHFTFTLDSKNSFISPDVDRRITIGAVIDSTTNTDSLFIAVSPIDSVNYIASSTNLNGIFQRWNTGSLPNLGLSMRTITESTNLDYFVFYSPTYSDASLVPRIRITYTPRQQ
ncbi:MAG TPA: hypothetical protein PKA90_00465 [Ignavibacteria bacterium]|nr:hypothetical protein [Ignavibacteria bacterium]HMR38877.1 hypothetical protein [Ignavibacteria bacterium]